MVAQLVRRPLVGAGVSQAVALTAGGIVSSVPDRRRVSAEYDPAGCRLAAGIGTLGALAGNGCRPSDRQLREVRRAANRLGDPALQAR